MKLGEYLRLGREIKKMSLRQLEAKTGISNALLSQIEHSHVTRTHFVNIVKIAKALRVPLQKCAELALAEERSKEGQKP